MEEQGGANDSAAILSHHHLHRFTQLSSILTHLNHLHFDTHRRCESLIGVQKPYEWGCSGFDSDGLNHHNIRKIPTNANCPRCFKHMDLLFSFPNCHNLAPLVPLGALDVPDDAHSNTEFLSIFAPIAKGLTTSSPTGLSLSKEMGAPPPSGNDLAVHTPPRPPFTPEVNVI